MTDTSPMQTLKPTVWIGKKGGTPEAMAEIRRQLEAKKPVKVRFLRGAEMDPEALAAETGGEILGVRGRTVVLRKER
ncbi:MAG TPA: YhbY family RNA-binding protein [Methanomicrobiales archaeon]|nr:YhbY family RNA-binding protein [Methanomicrobiales archaeon]